MSTNVEALLKTFDLLPESEKLEVASEIIRRAYAIGRNAMLDETQLAALYAEFATEDQELAEEGSRIIGTAWLQRMLHDR